MITLENVVEFILEHRKNKVFKGFTREQIALACVDSLEEEAFLVDVDFNTGKIYGVVLGRQAPAYKLLHICHILTISPGVIKRFVAEFKKRFPDWDLQANRHDNLIRYKNTPKLCERLLKYE
jgi:hypothetical protein